MKKTAIISGGSSGIGLATARKFSEEGYAVFVLDIQKNTTSSPDSHFIHCDIANVPDIQNAIDEISKHTQHVDALVCNAGIHFSSSLEFTNESDYDRVMNINFKGAFF